MLHDIYALISDSVFGFSHAAWADFARARAKGEEADVFDYAEVMLHEEPGESDPLPDDLRDVDSWTTRDWQEEFEGLANGRDWEEYLDRAGSDDETLFDSLAV